MTMNAVSNIERAKALYLAFSTGDFQTVIEALSSPIDFKANYPAGTALQAWAGQRSSPEEVLSYLSAVFTLQDIEVWETRKFFECGDDIMVNGFQRARVKATGRTYEQEWVHMLIFRDGNIARFRHWGDVGAVMPAFQD